MTVFKRLGGRGAGGGRGMTVFNRLGGRRHTAATGVAGISTDAALPPSKAASVLSRVLNFIIPRHDRSIILYTICSRAQRKEN